MERLTIGISTLSGYWYCPRNFLYRLSGFAPHEEENYFIADGRMTHLKQDHQDRTRNRSGEPELLRYELGSDLREFHGKADRIIVRHHEVEIIEHKRGRSGHHEHHHWQVRLLMILAQEHWPAHRVSGSLYYAKSRRRIQVELNSRHLEELDAVINEVKVHLIHGDALRFPRVCDSRCFGCMYQPICWGT